MKVAFYLFAVIVLVAVVPCILILLAWNHLPTDTHAWIATGVILLVDGLAVWFVKPFRLA